MNFLITVCFILEIGVCTITLMESKTFEEFVRIFLILTVVIISIFTICMCL